MNTALFRVPGALKAAGRWDELDEFLKRTGSCPCREEMVGLAKDYAVLNDDAGLGLRPAALTWANKGFGDLHRADSVTEARTLITRTK